MTKVSLIMTTFNCIDHFRMSIESALAQDYPNVELVIVDGGSTDGTMELIRQYADTYADNAARSIKWISERDNGIYDGMNKGIMMSTGDIIAVFNDLYTCENAITKMVDAIDENDYDGAHADLVYMDGNICKRYWHMGQGNLHFGWMPAHPTLYLKREVYLKYGMYNLKYHSSSDYEFMIRILKGKKRVRLNYIPEVLVSMYYGGTSNGLKGYPRNILEAYLALAHNHVMFPMMAILCRTFRTFVQYRKAVKYS